MGKGNKIKESYKDEKMPSIKEILTDANWNVDDIQYNGKTGKYDFKATYTPTARTVELSRNRQYVDNLLDELENNMSDDK